MATVVAKYPNQAPGCAWWFLQVFLARRGHVPGQHSLLPARKVLLDWRFFGKKLFDAKISGESLDNSKAESHDKKIPV